MCKIDHEKIDYGGQQCSHSHPSIFYIVKDKADDEEEDRRPSPGRAPGEPRAAEQQAGPNPAQTLQGPIPDKKNNPNPPITNPSPEVKSDCASQDPKSQAPAGVKIQEGTKAED